jgi:hypothetical protein
MKEEGKKKEGIFSELLSASLCVFLHSYEKRTRRDEKQVRSFMKIEFSSSERVYHHSSYVVKLDENSIKTLICLNEKHLSAAVKNGILRCVNVHS